MINISHALANNIGASALIIYKFITNRWILWRLHQTSWSSWSWPRATSTPWTIPCHLSKCEAASQTYWASSSQSPSLCLWTLWTSLTCASDTLRQTKIKRSNKLWGEEYILVVVLLKWRAEVNIMRDSLIIPIIKSLHWCQLKFY